MTKRSATRVGVIGCGVVGGGVVQMLLGKDRPWESDGTRLELVKVATSDWKGVSGVPESKRAKSNEEVLNHPDIDVIVELIGGMTDAKDIISKALDNGKHVVTANKALLAEKGQGLFTKAAKKNREIAFEAAVAGGIPVLDVLFNGFSANRIDTIYGILNGTTNFILTRMTQTGESFHSALKEAQRLGFAEADPRLDVEGIDTAHKIHLLAALAYGKSIPMSKIAVRGIKSVVPRDIAYARQLGCRIKLLAIARMIPAGIEISVAPTLVPNQHALAAVENELNAIFLHASRAGDCLLSGKGAGRYPTASAVMSDLIKIARNAPMHYTSRMNRAQKASPVVDEEYLSRYYIRASCADAPGVLGSITGILGKVGISIASVVQLDRPDRNAPVPVALLTQNTTLAKVERAAARINRLAVVRAKTIVYPFAE